MEIVRRPSTSRTRSAGQPSISPPKSLAIRRTWRDVASASSVFETLSQPLRRSTPGMAVSWMVVAHVIGARPDSAHSALAWSRPTRATTRPSAAAKPGSTKPVLRPDAFQATRRASSTTTDQPRRATSRAVVRPASPAADHADIDVDVGQRRPALGHRHRGVAVPARCVGRPPGRVHDTTIPDASGSGRLRPDGYARLAGSRNRCR